MQVTVSEPVQGLVSTLEMPDDITFGALKLLLEADLQVPLDRIELFLGGKPFLYDRETALKDTRLKDGDLLLLMGAPMGGVQAPASSSSFPPPQSGASDLFKRLENALKSVKLSDVRQNAIKQEADELLTRYASDPNLADVLELGHPSLATALRSRDRAFLEKAIEEQHKKKAEEIQEKQQRWLKALANPLDPLSQEFTLQKIREDQVQEAYERAQEFLPESFLQVSMLYVKVEVNKVALNAFVDCGAQTTIMSRSCADRCNLTHLIDTRFQGVAQGIGRGRICGRIHLVQIKMGQQYFEASLTILENDNLDFLFGLDLLKRHRCCINLFKNVLQIGTEELPFLTDQQTDQKLTANLTGIETTKIEGDAAKKEKGNSQPTEHDAKLQSLVALGFSRSQAESALESAKNDAQLAATLLFAQRETD